MRSDIRPENIDYSMLPDPERPKSVLHSIFLAIGITTGLLLAVGLVALLANFLKLRDATPLYAVISAIFVVGFIATMVGAVVKLSSKLSHQKKLMSRFAAANGWTFNGKRQIFTIESLPDFLSPKLRDKKVSVYPRIVRFQITGKIYSIDFFYTSVVMTRTIPYPYILGEGANSLGSRFTYATVLAFRGDLSVPVNSPNLLFEKTAEYSYITCASNLISKDEIKRLFDYTTNQPIKSRSAKTKIAQTASAKGPTTTNQQPRGNSYNGEIIAGAGLLLMMYSMIQLERVQTFAAAGDFLLAYLGFFIFVFGTAKAFYNHYRSKNLLKFVGIASVAIVVAFLIIVRLLGLT